MNGGTSNPVGCWRVRSISLIGNSGGGLFTVALAVGNKVGLGTVGIDFDDVGAGPSPSGGLLQRRRFRGRTEIRRSEESQSHSKPRLVTYKPCRACHVTQSFRDHFAVEPIEFRLVGQTLDHHPAPERKVVPPLFLT